MLIRGYKINWIKSIGLDIVTLTFFELFLILLVIDIPYEKLWSINLIEVFGRILLIIGNTLLSIEKYTV